MSAAFRDGFYREYAEELAALSRVDGELKRFYPDSPIYCLDELAVLLKGCTIDVVGEKTESAALRPSAIIWTKFHETLAELLQKQKISEETKLWQYF